MTDLSFGKACGGYTNEFKYVSGPAFDGSEPFGVDLSQFTFSEPSDGVFKMEGEITDPLWVGTH